MIAPAATDPAPAPGEGGQAPAAPSPAPAGRLRGRALLTASAVLFGLAAILAKLASDGGMSGGQVTLVRFGLGLAAVAALFRLRPGTYRPARWGLLAVRGLVGGAAALLYYLSIALIPAGEATLLNSMFPIFAVGISLFALRERPTVHLALALVLASAGVYLVLGGGELELRLGWGEAIGLLSAAAGGVAVTSIRALRPSVNAPTIFAAFALGGVVVSLPYAAAAWPSDPWIWGWAGGAGVAAFGGQLAMTEAYGALSIPEAALWQQLTPIACYLWALLLGEGIGPATALGVLLGLAGVTYGSLLGHRPGRAATVASRVPVLPAPEP
ncbi:MAG TPA: DMT family transporter [Anaeromyxobacter sp.]|nr:DMT family transporter [Anaeromyxobacter sp.]